jgi:hypothetical protein
MPTQQRIRSGNRIQAKVVALGKPTTLAQFSDLDLTDVSDGAILIYDAARQKFVATNEIRNSNITIDGGTY